jgi:alpha-glucosidase
MRMILTTIVTFIVFISACSEKGEVPESPDGSITISLGANGDQAFTYSVYKDQNLMVRPSAIMLKFRDQDDFGGHLDLALVSESASDETWTPLWGKTSMSRNHYNEYVYRLSERGEHARFLEWMIRVYDDGVAFRYSFPEESGFGDFKLTEESTSFNLDPSNKAWATNHEHYYSSQEHTYDKRSIGEIGPEELIGCPLLVEVGEKGWVLITEADLTDWAGLYFKASGLAPGNMVSSLASLKRDPEIKVEGRTPAQSPWRVIMVGDDPGTFIESNIIANLNDPSEYEDVSWIKPGLSAWDRWWSGDYGPDAGFELGMNTATIKYFIDLAHEMGWEYMIVDWTWYGEVFTTVDGVQEPSPDADITTPMEEVDIGEIIQYAGERDVKIILWVLSMHLDKQMDEALAQYEKWGAAGIKVDFMDCDDQDMVNWYHKVGRHAASHHLVVDFHGAYKPTGVSRTLPNLLTREGVLGNEYTKWSDLVTPRHTVTIPFTRGVLGEMDFTPGGFHHIHQEDFIIAGGSAPNPYVMGTRCHQLAMLVVYESAFGVVCDSPYNYRDQPGSDFLKVVPSTWDETRFLGGYPGENILIARRSGKKWFVGGMTNEESRELTFSLDFLGEGIHDATLWRDAEDAGDNPSHLDKEEISGLSSDAGMTVQLERGGGFTMVIN